jgi:carboxypeptidase C (cathepsin A)
MAPSQKRANGAAKVRKRRKSAHMAQRPQMTQKLYYKHKHKTTTRMSIPLIICLNGGPGCSSMDGVWLETGSFRLTQSTPDNDADHAAWTIDISEHSWHSQGSSLHPLRGSINLSALYGLSFLPTTSGKYATNEG